MQMEWDITFSREATALNQTDGAKESKKKKKKMVHYWVGGEYMNTMY
jgi:hypothetical protein